MAKVDIIMGIYNCEEYLAESIDSILNQTFKDWRLIMCDDKSTDDTLKIAERYAEKYPHKILLLKNKKNMGLNFTLNKCLRNADAEYIARQDGDDISKLNRLEKEAVFLDTHPDIAIVSTNAILFDNDGIWGELKLMKNPDKFTFLTGTPFCHASVMMRKEVLDFVGRYSVGEKLIRVEDLHLWFKMYAAGYRGYNIQTPLYLYRDDRNTLKRRTWQNRKNEYYVRKIGYKMLNIPWYLRFYKYRPIVLGLLPKGFYEILHRKRLGDKNEK